MDGDGVPNAKDDDENDDGNPYGVGVGNTPIVGISNQRAGTFGESLFTALGIRHARFITAWNSIQTEPGRLQAWLEGARAAGIEPLVSFQHAEGTTAPTAPATRGAWTSTARLSRRSARLPVGDHGLALERGEPPEPARRVQPAARGGVLQRGLRRVGRLHHRGRRRPRLTDLAGYIKAFRAVAKGDPQIWGLHNYSDANRFRTKGTDTMLASVPGQVWLTETGGVTEFTTTNADDRFDVGIVFYAGAPRGAYNVVRGPRGPLSAALLVVPGSEHAGQIPACSRSQLRLCTWSAADSPSSSISRGMRSCSTTSQPV